MKQQSWSVTFFDKDGNWADRAEELADFNAARKLAEERTDKGGYSEIHTVAHIQTISWTRKFKTRAA